MTSHVASDSSHSSTSTPLSCASTCVVVRSNGASSGGGTCQTPIEIYHSQMVGKTACLHWDVLLTASLMANWCETDHLPYRTRRNKEFRGREDWNTTWRISGQSIPLKNGCAFMSLAPLHDPSLLLGSLCNSALMKCLTTKLTCKHPI